MREAVDRETDWATVQSCTLHKGLPISEIMDLRLNDTFPADSGKVSCCPHMGGFQYFPHRQSVLWKGGLFQIGTKVLMNPWWPCTETKKERALALSLAHAHTHTTLSQAEIKRWTKAQVEKGQMQGGAGGGTSGVPSGRRRGKDVGRWLRDTGGSEVHRRGGRILRHSGGQGGMGEWNDGTILFGGVDCQSHPLDFVWMSCGEQSICPWVPREIPGQGSRGVARPSRLAAPSASMHHPPGRPWCLPAPGPRQGSVLPASGCHGPGVQLRPACPLWNNGEACWVVLGGDGWLRDRRLGKQLQRARKRGEALGAPRKVSDAPRP